MAGGIRLTRRALAALALCLGLALAGHVAVLAWWDGYQATATSPLRDLPDPLFTRLIAPIEPVPVAAAARPAPAAAAAPGVLRADLAQAPLAPAQLPAPPPAAAASAAASAPTPAPASAPAEAASSAQAGSGQSVAVAGAEASVPRAGASSPAPADAASAPATPASTTTTGATAASAATPQDTWPPDARLTYRLEGRWRTGPLYGTARVQWQRQGARYQAQVEIDISPFVHRALTSQGEVTPQGLVPRVYEERSRTRRRAMQLGDADITLSDGRSVPRPAGVQDTASQFVELGHRFAPGVHRLALGEVITLPLARPGHVDTWTYDVVAQDLVAIPRLGEVTAWRVRPRPMAQRSDNLSAEIWFAPSLRHLPVRIRITLGDEAEIDLKVETLEQR